MKYFIYAAVLLLPAMACHQKSPPQDPAGAVPVDSTQKSFFPVADFLNSEIGYLDSTPIAIMQYIIRDNRTDSSFISLPIFHQLAVEFTPPELAAGQFEKKYMEKSFIDQTTRTATFTYSTQDKDLSVQRLDILTTPGDDGNVRVQSVYMERFFTRGDTLVTKKMLWKAKKNFLIVTTLQLPRKAPDVEQLRVVWDTDRSE
jgi:hypothetical protein